jgi:M6 family metalloprotease-like protein
VTVRALLLAVLLIGAIPPASTGAAPSPTVAAQPSSACRLPAGGSVGAIDFANFYKQPVGTVKVLMLFVDFPDAPAKGSTAATHAIFDGAADWLHTVSYGRVTIDITEVPRWIRMPHPSTFYPYDRGFTAEDHAQYVRDAVTAADPTVDFAGYDVYDFVANQDAAAISFSPTFIFGKDSGIVADGASIARGVTFGADASYWGYKVFDHETGHTFGLPDYYAFQGSEQHRFVGGWDVMGDIAGQSPDLFAWDKWRLGWLSAAQIGCYDTTGTTDVTLTPLERPNGLKAVVLRTGKNRVTVAEYRTNQGVDDASCGSGVLVYTVDSAIDTGDGPIRVNDAHPNDPLTAACPDPHDFAARGPEDPAYSNGSTGITIKVLGTTSNGARIRTTRTTNYPADITHRRTLTLRATGASTVTFSGHLSVSPAYGACAAGRTVNLQRFASGTWTTVQSGTTASTGSWSLRWKAPSGRYRLVAPQVTLGSVRPHHVCLIAVSPTVTLA